MNRRTHTRLATVVLSGAALSLGSGCVSLAEYESLEQRFKRQEQYVVRNKHEVGKALHAAEIARNDQRKREREIMVLEERLKGAEEANRALTKRLDEVMAAPPAVPSLAALSAVEEAANSRAVAQSACCAFGM